jgi:hypothetical protein
MASNGSPWACECGDRRRSLPVRRLSCDRRQTSHKQRRRALALAGPMALTHPQARVSTTSASEAHGPTATITWRHLGSCLLCSLLTDALFQSLYICRTEPAALHAEER